MIVPVGLNDAAVGENHLVCNDIVNTAMIQGTLSGATCLRTYTVASSGFGLPRACQYPWIENAKEVDSVPARTRCTLQTDDR